MKPKKYVIKKLFYDGLEEYIGKATGYTESDAVDAFLSRKENKDRYYLLIAKEVESK